MNQSIKYFMLCLTGFLLVSGTVQAQVSTDSELFNSLKACDSILFEIGFNKCQIQRSAALMADDLEFYHDQSGISKSKAEFIAIMENGLCNKNRQEQIYRFLIDKSMEVYPLYDNGVLYGALQNGQHFFSSNKNMTYEESDNYAFFSHLWIIANDEWILKRVISYNHETKQTKS
jgi:hypothetical protein